jgi:hypothetical protein
MITLQSFPLPSPPLGARNGRPLPGTCVFRTGCPAAAEPPVGWDGNSARPGTRQSLTGFTTAYPAHLAQQALLASATGRMVKRGWNDQ